MTPIAQAVEPLRTAAQDRAAQFAQRNLDKMLGELEEAGWDLDKVAPAPHGRMSREQYRLAQAKRGLLELVTRGLQTPRLRGEPNVRKVVPFAVECYLQSERDACSLAYDAFVAKLEKKVGEHSTAELAGDHVWGFSVLTVQTPAGAQRWKTQQIVNVSCLGKVFNQWPSRQVK